MSLFGDSKTIELKIDGMHCEKCVARVRDALEAIEGVASVDVVLEPGSASVAGVPEEAALVDAVNALGFTAELV